MLIVSINFTASTTLLFTYLTIHLDLNLPFSGYNKVDIVQSSHELPTNFLLTGL